MKSKFACNGLDWRFPYGLADEKPKARTCLICGRAFDSLGPAHRICDECRRKNQED
jgi:hypothetical protein